MYSEARGHRKAAQSKVQSLSYSVESGQKYVAEAAAALSGRSQLSTQEKIDNLKTARKALKVVIAKNEGTEAAEKAQAARKDLKKALASYEA